MNNDQSKKNCPNGNDWRRYYKRRKYNSFRNAQPQYFIEENKNEASFFVKHVQEYDNSFPELRQPVELGSFVSEKRKKFLQEEYKEISFTSPTYGIKLLSNFKNKIAFLINILNINLGLPLDVDNCQFDLNLGASQFVPHIPHVHGIDTILQWILANKQKFIIPKSEASISNFDIY